MEVLARVLSLGRFCGEGLTQKLSSFSNVFFFLFFSFLETEFAIFDRI